MTAAVCAAVLLAACTGGSEEKSGLSQTVPKGGTLRVAITTLEFAGLTTGPGLDPQKDYWYDSWELFRCCLLRTLISHTGTPTEEGGAELKPDLAAAVPEVSDDGLTWTFRIKPGLRYAPPYDDTEIVAADFIRALEREADPEATPPATTYSFYYSAIAGFDDFAAGRADSISGLEAPDPHTLVVRVTEPQGDLGNLMTLAATAPIPEGAADGHDDGYGRFLVASGPYMIEGSEDLDFSRPPGEQEPVAGYRPRRSLTLVRNPSWSRDGDDLRPAYVDRIEIRIGGGPRALAGEVAQGTIDMQLNTQPPPQEPLGQVRRYRSDPELSDQVFVGRRDFLRYVTMNIARPPFDDIHVRKAVNFAIDKAALQDIYGGPAVADVTGHVVLDSLENNLLADYDPYATPNMAGSLSRAKAEMRQSKYDRDGDGVCDRAACREVLALTLPNFGPTGPLKFGEGPVRQPFETMARLIAGDLAQIGIELDVRPGDVFGLVADPSNKVPIALTIAWGKDFLNASTFIIPLFDSTSIGSNNFSLVGARPGQLDRWGYAVESVPSIDDKIDQCRFTFGRVQFECWAQADQLLMERVVPWVPLIEENHVQLVSDRVVRFSFDQFANLPALDRIALEPGSG
jgi:ABC-type transport system substrate-binding protein